MDIERAEKIATELVNQWLPGWTFSFNRRRTSLGVCSHTLKTIYLSKPITILNDEASVLDTIKHEIAHGIVGPGHGHDYVWKAKAKELGCSAERCGKIEDDSQEAKKVMGVKYQMILSTTGEVVQDYYRKPAEKTIQTISQRYITGRKAETFGKLIIVPFK